MDAFGAFLLVGAVALVILAGVNSRRQKQRLSIGAADSADNRYRPASRGQQPTAWAGYIDHGLATALWRGADFIGSDYWVLLRVRSISNGLELMLSPSRMGVVNPTVRIPWSAIVSATPGTGSGRAGSGGDENAEIRFAIDSNRPLGAPSSGRTGTLHLYEPEGSALVGAVNNRIEAAARRSINRAQSGTPAVLPPPTTPPQFVAAPVSVAPLAKVVSAPAPTGAAVNVTVAGASNDVLTSDVAITENALDVDATTVETMPSYDAAALTPTYDPGQFTPTYQQVDYTTALTSSAIDVNSAAAVSDVRIPITPYVADPIDDSIFTPTAPDIVITQPTVSAPWPPPQEFVLPDSAKIAKEPTVDK